MQSEARQRGAAAQRAVAEVIGNRVEARDAFRLGLRVPGWPGFEPGQFLMLSPGPLAAASRSDPLLPRPMAIYRMQGQGAEAEVEVLYKRVGRGTSLLAEMGPGARVAVVGPLGRPFDLPGAGEEAWIVGGGTGIATVYELARRAHERGAAVRLLLGAGRSEDLLALADFESLGVDLRLATEDGSRGARGRVTELLEAGLVAAQSVARVYACGPHAMLARCAQIAAAHSLRCAVALENRMACGFGVCLGCAVPRAGGGYALVCRDGPPFEARELDWEGLP